MDENRTAWSAQLRDGLVRITRARESAGKGRGTIWRSYVEFHRSNSPQKKQTRISAPIFDVLMQLEPGTRAFWAKRMAFRKSTKSDFEAWIKDRAERKKKIDVGSTYEQIERHGVHSIYSGGLPGLGKNR